MQEGELDKILERFPDYDGKGQYVGTKDYWRGVFSLEKNRDPELHEAFSRLHEEIVDKVVAFCKEHDLDVDEFSVRADGILSSKKHGCWTFATDSSMALYSMKEDGKYVDRENPFLYEI